MNGPDGFIRVDKPPGITSAAIGRRISHCLNRIRCGHLGTLDPAATGLLVIAVGRATKLVSYYLECSKRYQAVIRFGFETNTLDLEGAIVGEAEVPADLPDRLRRSLQGFVGPITQVPPAFSAVRVGGKRSYKLAREGRQVTIPARQVVIHSAELLCVDRDRARLEVHCSSGTYVRSLAADLARASGTLGTLEGLRRTESPPFALEGATPFHEIVEAPEGLAGLVERMEDYLPPLPHLALDEEQTRLVRHGVALERNVDQAGPLLLIDESNQSLLAIGEGVPERNRIRVKRLIRAD